MSTTISVTTIATIVLVSHLNTIQAIETNSPTTDVPVQGLSEDAIARMNLGSYMRTGKAAYTLNNPAIQFVYDPNFFVTTLSETRNDVSSSTTPVGSLVDITLWTKDDYSTLIKAGDEIGDFPPRVTLSVKGNPEGFSLEDWITTYWHFPRLENVRKLDVTITGQEAWGFSYTPIVEYDNIAFKDDQDRVIVLSFWLPERDDSASSESIINDGLYSAALSTIVESIELTATDQ